MPMRIIVPLLLLLAACAPAGTTDRVIVRESPNPPAAAPHVSESEMEAQLHAAINGRRQSRGLAPLVMDAGMAEIARQHSRDMAAERVPFGHDGFDRRWTAARGLGPYSTFAENVGYNDFPADRAATIAFEGFVRSSSHRRNLDGTFTRTGIGVARTGRTYYFTQVFAR
jgi:uncharacterized protein YkwD